MAISTSERDNRLNVIRGTAYPSVPTNFYVSLHSADPGLTGASELAGNGYARVAVLADPASWSAPATNGGVRQITNASAITFPAVSGSDWLEATHFGLWDASSGGDFKRGSALTDPKTAEVLDTISFPAGSLILQES